MNQPRPELKNISNEMAMTLARSLDSGSFLNKLVATQLSAATNQDTKCHLHILKQAIEKHFSVLCDCQGPCDQLAHCVEKPQESK